MRYDDPELRRRLAAEYVIGTMPSRARRRFERLTAADRALADLVADWETRFAPLDDTTLPAAPPVRVWRAVEQRIAGSVAPPAAAGWLASLRFWRAATGFAVAAGAALAVYVALAPAPPVPLVVAILSDHSGTPEWIALTGPRRGEVSIAALGPLADSTGHAFQLWAVAGGPPRALGLLAPKRGHPLLIAAAALPPSGATLAVSREPPGGSPTGKPTGPVLYQGKVLIPVR
ncbi:MAG TPA: anti-sigma factor [Stellaceae bacterium]|nr:anti-sigma factor [Stellaceae bacterium]